MKGLIVLLGLSAGVWAQTTSSEILGLVTDSTGAAIPGAKVTITRTATGEVRQSTTSNTGDYSFPAIDIGEWNVHVEAQGFKAQTITGVRVETQQKARVDIRLEVGALTETVEVSAQLVTLKTEDATVGQVIENRRIVELPLNGRNLTQLAVMVAGVQYGTRTGGADGQGGFPIPGSGISVIANGQREINQNVLLDGVDAKEPRTHITVFTPSIEAVEEFKVQTSSYSAEFGQGGGAQIQITMKSGGNAFHGTVFEFLRNDKLDAENYFLNFERPVGLGRLPKDRLRRNQFGAVVSGPVMLPGYDGKNRTFWAFDYEGRRETIERLQTAWFPNTDFRNGNFSALLTPATNPATGRPFRAPILVYDPLTGNPFANNIVPASRHHAGARSVIQQFLPPPQFQQLDILDFTNRGAVPTVIEQNQYFARIDHHFSDKDKVFGRLAIDRSRRDEDYINPTFRYFLTSRAANIASQWLHTFSGTTLNEFRFGFNIADDDTFNPRSNTDFDIDSLGIGKFRVFTDNNRKFNPRETGVPPIGFLIGDRDGGNGWDRLDNYQFADHLTLVRGRHSWKFGFEYRYITIERAAANIPRGSLGFGGLETGFNFASFLMGYPNNSSTGEGFPLTLPRNHRRGAYVMDEWKVNPRLTLNLGIRWDYYGVPVDKGGYWRTLRITEFENVAGIGPVPKVVPPGRPSPAGGIQLWENDPGVFQPRIGFAFRPRDKWVIRGGGGYFSNVNHMNNYTILNLMPPLSGSDSFSAVTDLAQTISVGGVNVQTRRFRPGQPVLTLDEPFPTSLLGRARRTNLLMVAPDHKQSTHVQWSLDLQRELPFQTALTVGYVGSKSTHVGNSFGNFNSPDPSSDTNINARRPYQRFFDDTVKDLGAVRFLDSYANGFYHGLQVTLEKRYSRGLAYGLAYTYSKSHGEGEAGGNEGITVQDPRNRRDARGRYSYDMRQNMVFHYVWELPWGKNLRGVAGHLLGGWQTNGILSLRTGFPFNITQGGDLNTGGPVFPDRIADGRLGDGERSRVKWFDPLAFRRVTCNIRGREDLCRYGSAGKGIIESPGQKNLDFSLFKNFALRENVKLQFRSEFFNTTNTPYFSQPNGIGFVSNDSIVPDASRMGEVRNIRSAMRIIQFGLKLLW
jgi:hypothetical protein